MRHHQQWQFYLKDVSLKINPTGGSTAHSPEVTTDKLSIVCMADNLLNKDVAGTGRSKNKKKKKKVEEDA